MDKFIVINDPNDKFPVVDGDHDKFAEHAQPHYKYAVTEDSEAFSEAHSPRNKYSVTEGSPESRFAEAKSPHHRFAVVDAPHADEQQGTPGKGGWSLRKKLIIGGVALVIILAVSIGLGVGLTQKKGGSDASQSTDGQGQQGSGNNTSNGSQGGSEENQDNSGSGSGGSNSGDPDKPSQPASVVPKIGDTFQIVIANPLRLNNDSDSSPNVKIFDIDLFDNSAETISSLTDNGRMVLCYFSAGTWEDWRDDKDYFDKKDLGKQLDDYDGEKYVNISSPSVRNIMKGRISRAAKAGCQGIDAGYVDSYASKDKTGLNLTAADAISYVKFLSTEARSHGLAVGLKNSGDLVKQLIDWVDYSVNEECLHWDECGAYAPFIDANKPVFNIEYPKGAPDKVSKEVREAICSKKGTAGGTDKFTTVLKTEDLDGWVMYCDGKSYVTPVNDLGT